MKKDRRELALSNGQWQITHLQYNAGFQNCQPAIKERSFTNDKLTGKEN